MVKRQPNMQRGKTPSIFKIDVPDEPQSGDKKINQYRCRECGEAITTIQEGDAFDGTTPMLLVCRATEGCQGQMISSFYRVSQDLEPDHEWYKPDKLPKDRAMREHVRMGGLLIRKIESATQ